VHREKVRQANSILQYKKQKKARIPFMQSQWDFLLSLLGVVMLKMKYDEDTEWTDESDEPEEEALFMEMRKVNVYSEEVCYEITLC
jgi:exportin-T